MQVKVVTIDVRLSDNTKRAIRWLVLPVAILAGSVAVAHAFDTKWIQPMQPVSADLLRKDLEEIRTSKLTYDDTTMPSQTEFILKAGKASAASGTFDVLFPTPFPNGVASVVVSGPDGRVTVVSKTNSSFTAQSVYDGEIDWIAVGW
jgi:hypothetical protein